MNSLPWAVELTPDEVHWVKRIALQQLRACAGKPRKFEGVDEREARVEGIMSEYATAKHLNLFWSAMVPGLAGKRGVDVGIDVETRWTRYDFGHLRVELPPDDHETTARDDPNARYVLATGLAPCYTLRGWLWGNEAQVERFWHDGYDCYWVAQSHLRPMEEFER